MTTWVELEDEDVVDFVGDPDGAVDAEEGEEVECKEVATVDLKEIAGSDFCCGIGVVV